MLVLDPIADMLTRIRNANANKHESVLVPQSKTKLAIAGQKAIVTTAKKSVANFKLRQGQKIGAKVTLRGERMYEFFDRLVSVALPRVRDFQGLETTSFDGKGNYSFGVKEQIIFPEIIYDKIEKVRGFDIMFITTAKTNEEALEMLKLMGVPFKKVK